MKVGAARKLKIESGVKITQARPGKPNVYPFDDMKPGDSFLIPVNDTNDNIAAVSWCRVYANVAGCFRNWRMSKPKERAHLILVTRNNSEGLRCWVQNNPWGDSNVD